MAHMSKAWLAPVAGAVLLGGLAANAAAAQRFEVAVDPEHGTEYVAFMQAQAAEFTKETGIEVNLLIPTDERNQIGVWAAAGELPDVIDVVSDIGLNYVRQNVFMDLRPFMKTDAVLAEDKFLPVALKAFALPADLPFAQGGMVYAIPRAVWNFNGAANTDLLAQAGLADPNTLGDDWTFDTFATYLHKLTQKDSDGNVTQYGGVLDTWIWRYDAWLRAGGGLLFNRDLDPDRVVVDSPYNRETLGRLVDWLASGVMSTDTGLYGQGKAAMEYNAQPNEVIYQQQQRSVETETYITFPHGPTGHYGAEFQVIGAGIASTSKQPQLAWRWLKWLWGDPERVKAFTRTTQQPPALKSLSLFYARQVNNQVPHSEIVLDSSAYPGTGLRPMVRDPKPQEVIQSWTDKAFALQVSPEEALAQAQGQAQAALSEAWARPASDN